MRRLYPAFFGTASVPAPGTIVGDEIYLEEAGTTLVPFGEAANSNLVPEQAARLRAAAALQVTNPPIVPRMRSMVAGGLRQFGLRLGAQPARASLLRQDDRQPFQALSHLRQRRDFKHFLGEAIRFLAAPIGLCYTSRPLRVQTRASPVPAQRRMGISKR